jgi:hypothetical protein
MIYSFRSDMLADLTGKSPRLGRRVASWFLLPICYFGLLISPAVILAIPFQIFHKHHLSPVIFWIAMVLIAALVLWMLGLALVIGLRFFRRRVIYIDAIVFFAALVFAVAAVFWIYPPK